MGKLWSKKLCEREKFLGQKIEAIEQTLDKNQVTETPKYFEYIKTKGEWESTVKNVPQELSSDQKPNG